MTNKTTITQAESLSAATITKHIFIIRNHKVLIDNDLAQLYGVPTRTLVQAVKRNANRFPSDFMFQLNPNEWDTLKSQIVISNKGRGGRRYAPYVFTEQGVAMLSSVLSSAQAIAVNIEIMRAFVRLREMIISNKELTLRLNELENKAELMEVQHDTFAHNTRVQFKQIFDAIRELMTPTEPSNKRPIGFVTPEDKSTKPKNIQHPAAKKKKGSTSK